MDPIQFCDPSRIRPSPVHIACRKPGCSSVAHDTCSCSAPTAPCHPIVLVLVRLPFGAVHLTRHGFACTPGTRERELRFRRWWQVADSDHRQQRKRGTFRRVDPSSAVLMLTRQCVSTCCPDWVSRYRQTGLDIQPSSGPAPASRSRDGASKQFPSTSWTNMLASSHRSRGRISGNSPWHWQAGRHKYNIN